MSGETKQCVCPACDERFAGTAKAIPDHEYALEHAGLYVECPACQTLFQEPMPGGAELASFYPADYHSVTHGGMLQRVRDGLRAQRLKKLAKAPGAILDFGCGDGSFLVHAAEEMPGRELWGFEIGERCETLRPANGRVTIVKGELKDLLERLPGCAVITMNHVIEHLPDPQAAVSALAARLVPGGVLEGQTPAADSLEHRVFGEKWSGYHSPRHTVVFSRAGLQRVLEKSGLNGAKISGAFNPAGVAVSLGSLKDEGAGRIRRSGWQWLALLAGASALAPADLLSGKPGIVDFLATKGTD